MTPIFYLCCCVAALTDAVEISSRVAVLLRSEGGAVALHGAHSISEIADAEGATPEAWPEFAVAKDEVKLGRLKGGTKPDKVRIGSSVYVRKKALEGEPQAIMMEALANNIYEAAHVKSAHCRYYPEVKETKAMMLCRYIDIFKPVFSFTKNVKQVASEHLVLDAVLGNYDVGGENGDGHNGRIPRGNVGWDRNNQLVRIDNGGALAADGLGQWKATEYKCKERLNDRITTWSPEPFQLWDFRKFSDVYNSLSRNDIVAQVTTLMGMKKELLATVENFGNGVAKERVTATLQARLECLGRIAKDRPDLFDVKHLQASNYYSELPKDVCDGVRSLCADLFVQKGVH